MCGVITFATYKTCLSWWTLGKNAVVCNLLLFCGADRHAVHVKAPCEMARKGASKPSSSLRGQQHLCRGQGGSKHATFRTWCHGARAIQHTHFFPLPAHALLCWLQLEPIFKIEHIINAERQEQQTATHGRAAKHRTHRPPSPTKAQGTAAVELTLPKNASVPYLGVAPHTITSKNIPPSV